MAKRKLQPFFGSNVTAYVIESHVKQVMKMATDGNFTQLNCNVIFEDNNWNVAFVYKTDLGRGKILLKAQEVLFND
jgi:hypothetical protein